MTGTDRRDYRQPRNSDGEFSGDNGGVGVKLMLDVKTLCSLT